MKTLILDHRQLEQKINRLAYQVYEMHYTESSIILAGIAPNGNILAERLQQKLKEISNITVHNIRLEIDKTNPLKGISCKGGENITLENAAIVLVDDVLNTGKTMIYGVKYFLEFPLKSLHTLVLVDRDHKLYPIHADMSGLKLSTNLKEHVSVELQEGNDAVYLR